MENLDDLPLIHRLETLFAPAKNWETSDMQLTLIQLLQIVSEKYPGLFHIENLPYLLEQIHITPQFNEHNCKSYYLINLLP